MMIRTSEIWAANLKVKMCRYSFSNYSHTYMASKMSLQVSTLFEDLFTAFNWADQVSFNVSLTKEWWSQNRWFSYKDWHWQLGRRKVFFVRFRGGDHNIFASMGSSLFIWQRFSANYIISLKLLHLRWTTAIFLIINGWSEPYLYKLLDLINLSELESTKWLTCLVGKVSFWR